ncbi:MAG: hypothetical protein KIG62_08960 [Oscillospiraceae bacterium]|nr:hypothetical protein [Oscillospiraceae bacterium]
MRRSKIGRIVRRIISAVLFIWVAVFIADNVCVMTNNPPIFCVQTEAGHYVGAGYSFDIYRHPISGETEQASYLFGFTLYDTFTNEVLPLKGSALS